MIIMILKPNSFLIQLFLNFFFNKANFMLAYEVVKILLGTFNMKESEHVRLINLIIVSPGILILLVF